MGAHCRASPPHDTLTATRHIHTHHHTTHARAPPHGHAAQVVEAGGKGQPSLREVAVAFAAARAADPFLPLRVRRTSEKGVPGDRATNLAACDKAAKRLPAKGRGGLARHACVEAVRAAVTSTFEAGMAKENRLFDMLVRSSQVGTQLARVG